MSADRGPLRLAGRAGLVLLGAVAGLLLMELAARLFVEPPRSHQGFVELHGELGFRGVPGTRLARRDDHGDFEIVLGSEGFRGRELPAGPGPQRRILFLGDSFLVGVGLREEELVPARAEQGLRAQGSEAEAYNLSTIDIGTGQQLLLLDRYGERLSPDEVVLFLYPANDIVNDTLELAGRTRVSPADALRPYVFVEGRELRREWVHPLRGPLRGRSRLFALVERGIFDPSLKREQASLPPAARVRGGGLPLEELEVFRRHDPGAAWERGWRRSFALLRALRDRCQALGARLLVVVIPSEHQVQRGAKVVSWDALTRFLVAKRLAARLDWNLPERRLAAFFRQEAIEARLLLAPLREAVAAGRRVYARDGHLSAEGHAVAAGPVLAWLAGEPAPGEPVAPKGPPVSLLPEAADAPAILDFAAAPHTSFLGDGWLGWGPADAGWEIADRALVVLPPRSGVLFVEGTVPEGAALPSLAQVEQLGGETVQFQLDAIGPFRIELSPVARRLAPLADGYAAFFFDPAVGVGPLALPLRVRRLGFGQAGASGPVGGGGE